MANTSIVQHISECFIRPKYEVQEDARNPIHLAPVDLCIISFHYIQTGLLFSKPLSSNSINQQYSIERLLDNLKHSLSLSLVHFYPLAGQFETEVDKDTHTSLIFINCKKGPGAKFIHAKIDMEVSGIISTQDVPVVVESFFDHDRAINYEGHTKPLLSIQMTELVDGVFIGCSINHSCCDGTSFWHFFNTLSEIFMANGDDNVVISRPPIHERWFVDGTGPIIKLQYTRPDEFIEIFERPEVIERIFHFSADSVAKLKAKAKADCGKAENNNISSFQSLSALIWRCVTRVRGFPDDVQTTCNLTINTRGRLNPPLSNNYFGNAIDGVIGSMSVGALLSNNLGWVASLLNKGVAEHTDEKVRMGLKAWMESPHVYPIRLANNSHGITIGNSPRFNVYENEFGMGKPLTVLSGYATKFDGMVTAFPGRDGGGSIDFHICLPLHTMRALQSDEELIQAVSTAS